MTSEIVALDLETTGLDISNDSIVQIGLVKFNSATHAETGHLTYYIIPDNGQKMAQGAVEKTGLTDEFIRENGVELAVVWPEITAFIADCDLLTYNGNHFDIPMLYANLSRRGLDFKFSGRRYYDSMTIERERRSLTLSNVYERYYNEPLEDAHDALNDVRATVRVFEAQRNVSEDDIEKDSFEMLSPEGLLVYDASLKAIVFTRGKYAKRTVYDVCSSDPNYIRWIFKSFSRMTCDTIKNEYNRVKESL